MTNNQPTSRGRAWAEHIARIQLNAKSTHLHHNGWENCHTCNTPSDYRRCGEPTCTICATP